MKNFRSILAFCHGESSIALRRAGRLAGLTGGSVTLCDVVEPAPAWTAALKMGKRSVPKLIVGEAEERLESLAKSLREKGLEVKAKVLTGKAPAVELTREVVEGKHDLLIKSADVASSRLPTSRFVEPVELQLVRYCPCPVFVARKRETGRHAGIVAAVAPPPQDDEGSKNIPNAQILETAIELAKLLGLELHVVRAWRAYGEGALRKSRTPSDELREYLNRNRDKYRAALEKFLEPYRDQVSSKRVHLLKGHPGAVVPTFAAAKSIDAVVMGSGPRHGLSEIFIGNTTESIVNDTECSIVAVKPKKFRTPVQLS